MKEVWEKAPLFDEHTSQEMRNATLKYENSEYFSTC